MIDYSVVIRTIGKTAEKYSALLDSIRNLNIQPREVIIVLPEGYAPPQERLGYEIFLFCKKGMLHQRIAGGEAAKGKYILFLDDDVAFEPSFIEKMVVPIEKGYCDATVPPQFSMLPPKSGFRKWIPMLELSACPMVFYKNYYTRILRSGGWSYNRFDPQHVAPYIYTHSAAGIGFFTRRDVFLKLNLQDELWVDQMKYAMGEDQVTFYKYWTCGYKIMCVTDAKFSHLDAGGNEEGRVVAAAYGMGFFKRIFWKRFIFCRDTKVDKIADLLAYYYGFLAKKIIMLIEIPFVKGKKDEFSAFQLGVKDAKKFIKDNSQYFNPALEREKGW